MTWIENLSLSVLRSLESGKSWFHLNFQSISIDNHRDIFTIFSSNASFNHSIFILYKRVQIDYFFWKFSSIFSISISDWTKMDSRPFQVSTLWISPTPKIFSIFFSWWKLNKNVIAFEKAQLTITNEFCGWWASRHVSRAFHSLHDAEFMKKLNEKKTAKYKKFSTREISQFHNVLMKSIHLTFSFYILSATRNSNVVSFLVSNSLIREKRRSTRSGEFLNPPRKNFTIFNSSFNFLYSVQFYMIHRNFHRHHNDLIFDVPIEIEFMLIENAGNWIHNSVNSGKFFFVFSYSFNSPITFECKKKWWKRRKSNLHNFLSIFLIFLIASFASEEIKGKL